MLILSKVLKIAKIKKIMKSIICNNCLSGYIYKSLKRQLDNPFFWNIIDYNSFSFLLKNFTTINFNSFTFDENIPNKIEIDKNIQVYYVHYCQSTNGKDEKVMDNFGGGNFYVVNLKDFIRDTYFRRLKRMSRELQDFLFIYSAQPQDTQEQINEILKYPNVFISDTTGRLKGERVIDTSFHTPAINEAVKVYEEIKDKL